MTIQRGHQKHIQSILLNYPFDSRDIYLFSLSLSEDTLREAGIIYSCYTTYNNIFHYTVIICVVTVIMFIYQWALCTAALLPELQPAPCFLSAIIGQID